MGDTGFDLTVTDSAATTCSDSELRHIDSDITAASAAFSGAVWNESEILAALVEHYGDAFARLAGVWKSIPPEAHAEIVAIATNAIVAW